MFVFFQLILLDSNDRDVWVEVQVPDGSDTYTKFPFTYSVNKTGLITEVIVTNALSTEGI